MSFKIGQIIRLKDSDDLPYLSKYKGRDLTVTYYKSDGCCFVSFAEDATYSHFKEGAWLAERFVAVEAPILLHMRQPKANTPAPNKAARAKNGRFASRTKVPVILRNGSLYNVARKSKGKRVLQVARLKVLTKDGKNAVMSRHGKLFFAKPNNLTLAPQSDVNAYLAKEE